VATPGNFGGRKSKEKEEAQARAMFFVFSGHNEGATKHQVHRHRGEGAPRAAGPCAPVRRNPNPQTTEHERGSTRAGVSTHFQVKNAHLQVGPGLL
jgi:hypothetical protein